MVSGDGRYETGHVRFRTTFSKSLVSGEISTCRRQTIDLLADVGGLFDGFARSSDGGFDDAVSVARRSLETCTKRLGKRVRGPITARRGLTGRYAFFRRHNRRRGPVAWPGGRNRRGSVGENDGRARTDRCDGLGRTFERPRTGDDRRQRVERSGRFAAGKNRNRLGRSDALGRRPGRPENDRRGARHRPRSLGPFRRSGGRRVVGPGPDVGTERFGIKRNDRGFISKGI